MSASTWEKKRQKHTGMGGVCAGNYAYVSVINEILHKTRNFRVLALSATPGNDVSSVQEVITNLKISNLEVGFSEGSK